tara:strand:+ start:3037 stop:3285 length:249 start_codon:yes stop_codon:yes gene_type:complete
MTKHVKITEKVRKFLVKFSKLTIHERIKVLNRLKELKLVAKQKAPAVDELYLMCLSISSRIDLGMDQNNLPELILGEQKVVL